MVALICAAVLCLVFSSCAPVRLAEDVDPAVLVRNFEKRSELVQLFRMNFTRKRQCWLYKRTAEVKGRLIYRKPNQWYMKLHGDAHFEVLYDGNVISVEHESAAREVYRADQSRHLFSQADPLMVLLQCLTDHTTSLFFELRYFNSEGVRVLEFRPRPRTRLTGMRSIQVSFSGTGEVTNATIVYSSGDLDETILDSWEILARDDPAVLELDDKLETLRGDATTQ